MMIRYYFGLRGESVTPMAIASDSPFNLDEMVAQIVAAHDIADIDDDGNVEALNDDQMILLYLFGLEFSLMRYIVVW